MLPSLFISHGSPTVLIEQDSAGHQFLKSLADDLPTPKAIVIISAHWETRDLQVSATETPQTLNDFYGFPKELYQQDYSFKGSALIAERVSTLTGAKLDHKRGLDHGAWIPMALIYGQSDIPVIQLSLPVNLSAQALYEIGQKLAPLRNENILIMASGAMTHNLGELEFFSSKAERWAIEAEDWFAHKIKENDHHALLKAATQMPHFAKAHPRDEHWKPIYMAMGAAQSTSSLLHRGFEHKNLSMAAARFD
ncbi:Extradiol aromatic ring-opening dioxygenase [Candidatus Terasakiella magnetica]|uniref:Extradiol aromatic ring-opening dioxygenase n=1 Tax=Candidatus Terasakiella magnetica TaxID=1867952 RepID=A0A1C3REB4_9PROT|nr:class III extradiol ring-cleavage dioxygenase [Candidatus Terasakiella magnetica]SCA55636.1 Extradiol aromatic ring-opening dioxygenase [Candidatus Terasakiella magnetica]